MNQIGQIFNQRKTRCFQPKKNQMFPCDRQMLQAWDRQGILWPFPWSLDLIVCSESRPFWPKFLGTMPSKRKKGVPGKCSLPPDFQWGGQPPLFPGYGMPYYGRRQHPAAMEWDGGEESPQPEDDQEDESSLSSSSGKKKSRKERSKKRWLEKNLSRGMHVCMVVEVCVLVM